MLPSFQASATHVRTEFRPLCFNETQADWLLIKMTKVNLQGFPRPGQLFLGEPIAWVPIGSLGLLNLQRPSFPHTRLPASPADLLRC